MKVNYGDLGIVLVAGALLYIVSKSSEQNAQIGIVGAKDPCANLTGATYTACRKVHPIKKKAPAIPSRFQNVNRPIRRPPVVKKQIELKPRENIIYNPGGLNKGAKIPEKDKEPSLKDKNWKLRPEELGPKCNAVAQWMFNFVKKNDYIPQDDEVLKHFPQYKVGWNDIYECAYEKVEKYVSSKENAERKQQQAKGYKLDSTSDKYSINKSYEDVPTDIKPNDPLGNFVNSIGSALQNALNNLLGGKTAIGGQPTVLTGSPAAPSPCS